MANNKYLDSAGLAVLWSRIQQLVYECASKNSVKYRLESNGNTITLVGSDGSRSTVSMEAYAACDDR